MPSRLLAAFLSLTAITAGCGDNSLLHRRLTSGSPSVPLRRRRPAWPDRHRHREWIPARRDRDV